MSTLRRACSRGWPKRSAEALAVDDSRPRSRRLVVKPTRRLEIVSGELEADVVCSHWSFATPPLPLLHIRQSEAEPRSALS